MSATTRKNKLRKEQNAARERTLGVPTPENKSVTRFTQVAIALPSIMPGEFTERESFVGAALSRFPIYTDIPEEFFRDKNPYSKYVGGAFFGAKSNLKPLVRPGIDAAKARRHLNALLCSFEPGHEHKIAAVAWLMSLWFELR